MTQTAAHRPRAGQPRRPDVLFRVAAGPGIGFGHLVRCRVLADALGVAPIASIRGATSTRRRARQLGWQIAGRTTPHLIARAFRLVVVDDPTSAAASAWTRVARAAGVPCAVIRDGGAPRVRGTLTIDGSGVPVAPRDTADLQGPRFAILAPAVTRHRAVSGHRPRALVVITLGGGRHVRLVGPALARAIRALMPAARIAIVQGFTAGPMPALPAGCRWVAAPRGVAPWLRRASVAVVAGGMTLYEACALGVPVVALAVVPPQRAAIRAFAREGAIADAGLATSPRATPRAAGLVVDLLSHPMAAARLGARAMRLVDGRGAQRVARALAQLAESAQGTRHAA